MGLDSREDSQTLPITTSHAAGAEPTATARYSGDEYLRIEQVSARLGLTKRTLRYYEEIGLLAPPSRTEGGYRLYSAADIQRLDRIKRLKDLLGFSLSEIREYVSIEERRDEVRAAFRREIEPHARLRWLERSDELLRQQLRFVDERLTGLQEMRDSLRERLETIAQLRAELHTSLDAQDTPSD
jgi:DNA-binding transcriptional MerR regulator